MKKIKGEQRRSYLRQEEVKEIRSSCHVDWLNLVTEKSVQEELALDNKRGCNKIKKVNDEEP